MAAAVQRRETSDHYRLVSRSWARGAAVIGVAVIPALFWGAMMVAGAALAGYTLNTTPVAVFSGTIALFLAAVCAPIMLHDAD